MMMNKGKIEIFTAGCPICIPVVERVNAIAKYNYEVLTYDLVNEMDSEICLTKVEAYGIKRLPAIVFNGKLLQCCQGQEISNVDLMAAGIL